MDAVKLLTPQSPAKLVVDVLRQASKSCCVRLRERYSMGVKQESTEITKARLLIEQAVRQVKIRTI